MYYYKVEGQLCCSTREDLPFERAAEPGEVTELHYLFEREPDTCRASFKVNDPAMLFQEKEDVSWLCSGKLKEAAKGERAGEFLEQVIKAGRMRAVNIRHPRFREVLAERQEGG